MYDVLIIRNGEISIKGKNRSVFEKRLIDQLKFVLREFQGIQIHRANGRIQIELSSQDHTEMIERIKNVFGVVSISPALRVEKGYDQLAEGILRLIEWKLDTQQVKTFKMNVRRQDKSFPMKSVDMAKDLGAKTLKFFDGRIQVDVLNPDLNITAEY